MSEDIEHRPSLLALAGRADRVAWDELWLALGREEREAALMAYLADPRERGGRQLLAHAIHRGGRGYSLAKLLARSSADLVALGAGLRNQVDRFAMPALVAWLLNTHGRVQHRFFEATGNGERCNEAGIVTVNGFGTTDQAVTAAGCESVLSSEGDIGLVYLLALCAGFADRWHGIREAMTQWATQRTAGAPVAAAEESPPAAPLPQTGETSMKASAEAPPAALPEPPPDAPADATAEAPASGSDYASANGHVRSQDGGMPVAVAPVHHRLRPVPEPQLTLLDDLLTRTILATWAGAEHALSREELEVLLEEVVHVNTERRRTTYHLGFADALFGEPWRARLNARSEERRAWYAAGFLTGIARGGDVGEVAACFEQQEDARLLATRPWPPFQAAADVLLPALAQAGRCDALAAMAPVAAVLSMAAVRLLAEQGRLALERRDPGMALAFLQPAADGMARRLASVPPGRSAVQLADLQRLDQDVRRRVAHAWRLTGANEEAKAQLEALLLVEREPAIRGMILTDLVLVGAGLRELAELQVPDDRSHHPELASSFAGAQPLLDEAMGYDRSSSAHPAYVQGILALLTGRWAEAAVQLRVALDTFEARPTVYTGRGLLRNARLYTATAELLALEHTEVSRRAIERLCALVAEGERPPRCFLLELITNALLVDQPLGEAFMDAVRERQLVTLDALASVTGVVEHDKVATAMATAALDPTHGMSVRVNLAYRALPAMVQRQDADRMESLLAVLEDGAADGVETARFLKLLDTQRSSWELCWDRVEAKWSALRVALASGDVLRAQASVRDAFYTVVGNAGHRHDWAGEAEDLFEAFQRCGASAFDVASLRAHLPGERAVVPPPRLGAHARHRILLVGGNEIQARFEDALRASLAAEFGEAIRLECYYTGMVSTWNRQLEDVERLLPRVDAVVLSRFIRTQFGRNLRRMLGTRPWRTCGSGGMGRVRGLVVELAGELERKGRA